MPVVVVVFAAIGWLQTVLAIFAGGAFVFFGVFFIQLASSGGELVRV